MSPEVPGSEAIVPQKALSHTFRKIERRWSSQVFWKGEGACAVAIQKLSTAGCIAQTKATDESPRASVRSISQIGRVDADRLSQMPPCRPAPPSTGTLPPAT